MPEGVDAGDQSFMAISSALVLLMTPGLAFFYGGMVREKNILNTMMMSLIAMGIVSFLWMAFGFSIAFTWSLDYVFLEGLTDMVWPATRISGLLFAIYQMTFAIITCAIISGAIVERVQFKAYCVFITIWLTVIYLPLCNWVWGGGWIFQVGAKDFAGGTVVHISSGTSAYVCAALLGRRRRQAHTPHNVPFVVLGGSLLWFGWTGFNGGSALAANDLAGLAIATTFIAAAVAMVAWNVAEMVVDGHASAIGAISGVVAGLVGITPLAGFVSPSGAVAVGAITAFVCFFAVKTLGKLNLVDDSLDCYAVHGVGGYCGGLLGGFFDKAQGIVYGHGGTLLVAQFIGVSAGMLFSAVGSALIFIVLQKFMVVRVLDHEEDDGVDQHMHKETAYRGEQVTSRSLDPLMSQNPAMASQNNLAMMSSNGNFNTMTQMPAPPQNQQMSMMRQMFCCVGDFGQQGGQVQRLAQ
eukprot:TRINITY_DN12008_c0_g1_i1.p1 TRINITY_DN12008_c0_g1~~TRINITY_DN12008_c0_g1_i1.p1  ORF type:complete len:466 (+),score=101.98 TRINITY_DN12008_c0_g1_i1:93-1490(+)